MLGATIVIAAALWGVMLHQITKAAITRRTEARFPVVCNSKAAFLWAAANALIWLVLYIVYGPNLRMMEMALVLSACIVLSTVDLCAKRIPNWSVLLLLIGAIGSVWIRNEWGSFGSHMLGAVLGMAVFLAPHMFGMQVGMGDIKLAAAIGFYLGAIPAIGALLIMSVLVLFYTVFLILTKRGSMKSSIAYGPYMAAGFLVTLAMLR